MEQDRNRFEIHATHLLVRALTNTQRRAIGPALAVNTHVLDSMIAVSIVIAFKNWDPHREVPADNDWNTNYEVQFHKVTGRTDGTVTIKLRTKIIAKSFVSYLQDL